LDTHPHRQVPVDKNFEVADSRWRTTEVKPIVGPKIGSRCWCGW